MPQASLVIPSIHRTGEVARLFESLSQQTCQDFEIILVDQNYDDRLVPIVQSYSQRLRVKHVRSQPVGASKARNLGLPHVESGLVLWPDDDSWFPVALLDTLIAVFAAQPGLSGAMGILVDGAGYPHQRWVPTGEQNAGLLDALIRSAEPVLFFRTKVVRALQGFDEALGTGAQTPWGAGEGADLCIRAIQAGYALKNMPALKVFHANIAVLPGDAGAIRKARSYARGMGAVLKKNRMPLAVTLPYILTYLRALLWNCIRGRWGSVHYHWNRFKGLLDGINSYPMRPK